jgi:hypothetical protein
MSLHGQGWGCAQEALVQCTFGMKGSAHTGIVSGCSVLRMS